MKSKMRIKKRIVGGLLCLLAILSVSSCAGDGFDEETFSGGVTGVQLESPEASGVTFEKRATSEENRVKITWPVVMGAGGYRVSFYVVDDPENPVAVVKDTIVDGAMVMCPFMDDTNYQVEITALGNERLNNTEARTATQVRWSTLVPATSIPDGTDLTVWFTENPVTTGKDQEVAYELVPGGSYTISGDLDFGINNVQLRGSKVNHAKVRFTDGASIITAGGGLALKFIEFDCDVVTGGAFLKFGNVPEEIKGMNSYGIVTNPMVIQSCEILNVRGYLVHINGKNYAIQNFAIRDCLVKLYQSGDLINFNGSSSFVKDFEISKSTFYDMTDGANAGRFIRVAGGDASKAGWTSCSMNFVSNTFYNLSYKQQSFNSNVWNRQKNTVLLKKNIFYNSCNGEFNRRIVGGRTDNIKTCEDNCYWYNNALPLNETSGQSTGDKSTSAYGVDPGFADPLNGDFTPSAPEIFSHGSGDPRWLNK